MKMQSWNEIYYKINHNYNLSALKDFILLKSVGKDLILINETECKKNCHVAECYMTPYYFSLDLKTQLFYHNLGGRNIEPCYESLTCYLYRYATDVNTYVLIWYNAVCMHMCQNHNYYNLDKNIVNSLFDLTCNELENRTINYKYIYGNVRKNFLPIDTLVCNNPNIETVLQLDNIDIIIDYIGLIIDKIKANYRMIVIFDGDETEKITGIEKIAVI